MANPGLSHAASATTKFKGILIAKGSETTNAQFTAGSSKFSTATPGSFAVGNYISGSGIQKGTRVTDIDSNDIYISRALTGTLANGATVTTWNESVIQAGGPEAFELIGGTGISLASSASASGAPAITVTASGGGTASALAADDLSAGDAAVTLTTTTGNITIDAAANNSDIIFKGTDGGNDTTFLTLDGSEEGKAIFNADVTVGDDLSLISDGAILNFGANEEIKMTHVHNTGILLTHTAVSGNIDLQFRDADTRIQSRADGTLGFVADGIANITAPDVNLNATTKIVATTPLVSLDAAVVQIKNTVNDTASSELKFVKDKGAAGADGDDVGKITFVGDDSAQTQTSFGQILVEVSEADDSDEAGKMSFLVAESDGTDTALTAGLIIEGEHATDGQVDVTIGAGAASTTTISGNLVVNGTTTTISSTTLEVTDDLITVSKGNDSLTNANGSGMEIECTDGSTDNIHWKYVHARTALQSNVDIDLATTNETLKIAGTDVLSNNTLGTGVVTSSLTTVDALNAGSITSGFGTIDTGSSTITTSGTLTGGAIVGTSLAVSGTITGDTSLTLDSTTISTAEIGVLDGVTAGTVTASKALVVDGSRHLATIGNLTSDGTVQAAVVSVDAVAIIDTSSADSQTVANNAAHVAVAYAYGTYRTAKFVYQITDGTDFESGEILVNYKGASAPSASTDIYLTQYAVVSTKSGNASLVSWDAIKTGTNIELKFTNASGGSVDYTYDIVNTLVIK
jgi:hypothetical protein